MRLGAVAALTVALLLAPAMGGCLDQLGLGGLGRPDYRVSRTPLSTTEWNTDGTFTVQVQQQVPVEVRIEAIPAGGGAALGKTGLSNLTLKVELAIPDGTWTVTYYVDGHRWERFEGARIDTVPPEITGLQTIVRAPDGSALLGDGADLEAGATLRVSRQDGAFVSATIPVQLSGLADGVHAYTLVATDPAGNQATATVQVISGAATELPEPLYTAGIVARYTTELRLWDLTDLDGFATPAAARSQVQAAYGTSYLGSGKGITPGHAAVQAVVDEVVKPGMSTGEAALALYRWMFDELEYDEARLDESDLLDPAQTIQAKGGVCRDLAGLYVSLLRAAGIPARIVAGYLTGNVNGFHAWVEFYGGGGQGPSPWVPVDVSGIGLSTRDGDDLYSHAAMLQAFGVALPGHLAMRALTPEEEQTDWSTAALLSWSQTGGSNPPDAPFLKDVDLLFETKQDLCVNLETFARAARQACTAQHNARIQDFPVAAGRVLDYGIEVRSISSGTTLSLSIVYPDRGATAGDVDYLAYFQPPSGSGLRSAGFAEHPGTGRAEIEVRR